MILKTHLRGKVYEFKSLREVMGKANEEKSGDNLAGVSAESAEERVAAKAVLQHITLKDLFENPAVPYETDEVTRIIIDGIDPIIYRSIQSWTVSELSEWLLDLITTLTLFMQQRKSEYMHIVTLPSVLKELSLHDCSRTILQMIRKESWHLLWKVFLLDVVMPLSV